MFAYLSFHYMETTTRKTDWSDSRILPVQSSLDVVFVSVHTMQPKSNKQCKFTGHVSNWFYPTELLQNNCCRNWPRCFIFVSVKRSWNGFEGKQYPCWSLKNKLSQVAQWVTTNTPCYCMADWLRQWKNGKGHTDMDSLGLLHQFPKIYFHYVQPEAQNLLAEAWEVSGPYTILKTMVWSGFYTNGIGRNRRTNLQDWAADNIERRQLAQVLLKGTGRSQRWWEWDTDD